MAALAVSTWLASRELPQLQWLTAASFVFTVVAARLFEPAAFAVPLSVAFIVPAIFIASIGRFAPAYLVVWFGAMLGALVGARGSWGRWSVPRVWELPLGLWATIVAVAWPVVVAREADFTAAWFTRVHHMANSNIGGPPPIVAIWVITCALTVLVGLLWFDRLFAYADNPIAFRRWVVYPLAVGAIASGALGMYQGLVDLHFLNARQWPELGRAGGGLIDAGGFGAGAGFMSAAFVALAASGGPVAVGVGALGAIVSLGGLWESGSRMAMMAGLIGFAIVGAGAVRIMLRPRLRWPVLVAALVLLIGAAAVALRVEWETASPMARAIEDLPSPNLQSVKHFVKTQLFDRGAPYGTASVRMFLQSPLVGVGIGTYNSVFPDYALVLVGARWPFDNAQSWYRQQFAEMGLLGSVGWLWWLATVAWLLLRTVGSPEHRLSAIAVKGSLVAIALVTAVSLPTQDSAVALLPWTLVFWYLQLSPDARARLAAWPAAGPAVSSVVAWTSAAAFVALTLSFGVREFRPSMRAAWADWRYTAGFYDVEGESDIPPAPFQWTEGHAVQTVRVAGPWLKMTVGGGPEDMNARPVRLVISRRYKPVIDIVRSSPEPLTFYIASGTERQMIIGIDTSRTFPAGAPDMRQLGVRVADWAFVAEPPPGAVVIR